MYRKLLLTAVSLIAIFALAACSNGVELGKETERRIYASGTGQAYLNPDIAYITIGVESRSEQVASALSENNSQTEKVANVLKELGVEELDIQTTAFNIYPQQQYSPMGEVTGVIYVVSNSVYVTVRDLGTIGEMLDAVVRAGANNIYGIQFDVEDKVAATNEARRKAIEQAKANAVELADAAEVELGELVTLNAYPQGGPVPIYEGKGMGGMMAADQSVPVSSGQLVITVNADLVYEIK